MPPIEADASGGSSPAENTPAASDAMSIIDAALAQHTDESPTSGEDAATPDTAADEGDAEPDPTTQSPAGDETAGDGDSPDEADAEPTGEAEPGADDLTDEDISRLNQRTQKRIKDLLDERNSARTETDTLKTDLEAATTERDALLARIRPIDDFMAESGLSPQQAANALQIAAQIEHEPFEAYENLLGLLRELAPRVGAVLSPDLKDAVQRGEITEERARELSRARAREQHYSKGPRRAQRDEPQRETRDTEAESRHVQGLTDAVNQWVARHQSDPDWKRKEQMVTDLLKAELRDKGLPKTAAEMVSRADAVLKRVDASIAQMAPKPRRAVPTPETTGGRAQSTARPKLTAKSQPVDVLDAVLGAGET